MVLVVKRHQAEDLGSLNCTQKQHQMVPAGKSHIALHGAIGNKRDTPGCPSIKAIVKGMS